MPTTGTLSNIIKISYDNYNTLISDGSVTIGGSTYTYDASALYMVQDAPLSGDRYHTTGSWSGLTYTAYAMNSAPELSFTLPVGSASDKVAAGNHIHSGYYTHNIRVQSGYQGSWTNPVVHIALQYYGTSSTVLSNVASLSSALYTDGFRSSTTSYPATGVYNQDATYVNPVIGLYATNTTTLGIVYYKASTYNLTTTTFTTPSWSATLYDKVKNFTVK